MYFNASERIARKTSYSYPQIEKIDSFLAGPDVKRFELHQLQEKTGLYSDVSPILEAYIRERILSKETVYLCPEHLITLETVNRNEGRCIDCDTVYPFEDCPKKTLYERRRKPDRQKATEANAIQNEVEYTPWWKDIKFVITSILAIVATLIAFAGSILSGDTINIFYPSDLFTSTPVIEQTTESMVTSNSEPIFQPTEIPAVSLHDGTISDRDMTSEITPEVTHELEIITEESDQQCTSENKAEMLRKVLQTLGLSPQYAKDVANIITKYLIFLKIDRNSYKC